MAKKCFTGATLVLSVDVTGAGSTFNQLLGVRNLQPPPDERDGIDCQGIDDDDPEPRTGVKKEAPFSFELKWDPSNTQDAALRTAFEAHTLCNWKAVTTDGSNTNTDTWDGYITGLVPLVLDKGVPKIMRVMGLKKGAYSEAVT